MEQQSYLSDIEFNPVFAGAGKRFLNCLIDLIIFYVLIVFVVAGLIYGSVESDSSSYTLSGTPGDTFSNALLMRIIFLLIYALFYCLSEIIFNGRTIGKFITGTRAVNVDGTEMNPKTILLRSLSRAVPFEPFSAFGGHPWHDTWTGTCVIDVRKTALNTPAM